MKHLHSMIFATPSMGIHFILWSVDFGHSCNLVMNVRCQCDMFRINNGTPLPTQGAHRILFYRSEQSCSKVVTCLRLQFHKDSHALKPHLLQKLRLDRR
jgi:hypothetical protein